MEPSRAYSYCPPCASAYQAEWRKANAEKKAAWFESNRMQMRALTRDWQKKNLPRRRANDAHRYATKLQATPKWASPTAIKAYYESASEMSRSTGEPHEVDHIVPLQAATVCGLHCEANLQVLTALENKRKLNRRWPDMPESPPEMAATGAQPGPEQSDLPEGNPNV